MNCLGIGADRSAGQRRSAGLRTLARPDHRADRRAHPQGRPAADGGSPAPLRRSVRDARAARADGGRTSGGSGRSRQAAAVAGTARTAGTGIRRPRQAPSARAWPASRSTAHNTSWPGTVKDRDGCVVYVELHITHCSAVGWPAVGPARARPVTGQNHPQWRIASYFIAVLILARRSRYRRSRRRPMGPEGPGGGPGVGRFGVKERR